MLLVSVLMACLCLAQSPPPASTGTPGPVPAPKRQQRQQTANPNQQRGQSYQPGQLRARSQTAPAEPAPNSSIQATPEIKRHHKQGRHDPPAFGGPNAEPKKNPPSYWQALRNYKHERHDRTWWKQRYTVIVLVLGGYYYFDNGYWCPAWGFDTSNQYYDYDGPIYTYGNLLPDQVIANVQRAIKELGYYTGEITGSLKAATREAIAAYQQDNGLEVTGVVDAATVGALGLE